MNALLLAAGLGTRLRPITDHVPKCMIEIAGRPLLDYWIEMLVNGGVERIVINTHYLPDVVSAHVAASRWAGQIKLVHEAELLGTGGTILRNAQSLADGAFLVAHADNFTLLDLAAFQRRHRERPPGSIVTMMTFDSDDPQSCGIVELDDAGRVVTFHEKVPNAPGILANGAVYIFEPECVEVLADLGREVIDLSTEVMPLLLGRIFTYHNAVYHRDIGTPESLEAARRDAKQHDW